MLLPINDNKEIIIPSVYNSSNYLIDFVYDNQRWYFVFKSDNRAYNEIISCELAKDYQINSAECYMAKTNTFSGIISKSVYNDNEKFWILSYFALLNNIDCLDYSNSIKYLFELFKKVSSKDAEEIHKQLIEIFLFDILIGNPDRNASNIGILKKDNSYKISDLFDNETIGNNGFTHGNWKFKVTNDKEKEKNALETFFVYYPEYIEYLKSKLWIIEEENLNKIFTRIEINKKIYIPYDNQLSIKSSLKENLKLIKEVINKFEKKEEIRKLAFKM